ncbi:hypothetical protein ACFQAT_16650 [Undibacterium arcticum]|uniref:hypothetical protein n=1 Tax=Undibacterium arcticum TaxID=1762892 RepID=UPI00361122A4
MRGITTPEIRSHINISRPQMQYPYRSDVFQLFDRLGTASQQDQGGRNGQASHHLRPDLTQFFQGAHFGFPLLFGVNHAMHISNYILHNALLTDKLVIIGGV